MEIKDRQIRLFLFCFLLLTSLSFSPNKKVYAWYPGVLQDIGAQVRERITMRVQEAANVARDTVTTELQNAYWRAESNSLWWQYVGSQGDWYPGKYAGEGRWYPGKYQGVEEYWWTRICHLSKKC